MTEALRIVAIRSAKQGRKPTVRPPPQEEEDGWSVLNTHTLRPLEEDAYEVC